MQCPHCGYDLGDGMLPARCPSCAHNLANSSDAPRGAAGAHAAAESRAAAAGLAGSGAQGVSGGVAMRQRAHNRKRSALIALAGIVAAVALGVFLAWHLELWGGQSLPDVVGWNVDRATKELKTKGYTVSTKDELSDEMEGLVVGMDPTPGSRNNPGSKVVLKVAKPRTMPEVVGKTRDEADDLLSEQGLKATYKERFDDGDEGMVLESSADAGSTMKSTDKITLYVSKARTVPDVSGKSESDARKALEDAGYKAKVSYVAPTSDQKEGVVVEINPTAGTKLAKDSEVTIKVTKSRIQNLEESAKAIITVVYNCNPTSSSIGAGLRPYLADSLATGSEHDIWYNVVKRGGATLPDGVSDTFQALPRSLGSLDVSADANGTVTCTFSVTWDWSPMGSDYTGITSTDTRTVTLTFDDNDRLTAFSDPQTDIPYYTMG